MPIVMKFGGTSVADAAALDNVARIVASQQDNDPVVVVSAMSGVTDSLLASTRIATDRSAAEAVKALNEAFRRHHYAAQQLLSSDNHFNEYLDRAAVQLSQLLQKMVDDPNSRRATQDAIVSFGEMLSSALLAEVLKPRGVNAEQVDPRHCILTNDEYTCAAPLLDETFARTHQTTNGRFSKNHQ